MTAKDTTNDGPRKAFLLLTADAKVQDIFYTLAGLEEDKTFNEILKLLDEYFTLKSNIPLELIYSDNLRKPVTKRLISVFVDYGNVLSHADLKTRKTTTF